MLFRSWAVQFYGVRYAVYVHRPGRFVMWYTGTAASLSAAEEMARHATE